MNNHNHRPAGKQPIMHKCGGHTWHLLRIDGTDETQEPTGINPLDLPYPKR